MKALDLYYEKQFEPQRSCLLSLREYVLSSDADFTESLKWSIPCFSYQGKIALYFNLDKKSGEPYLLFNHGSELTHPALESKGRKLMKSLAINSTKDLPLKKLDSILEELKSVIKQKRS